MEITINNWDEYNPRKDLKKPSWFRLENDILTNQKLFGFSAEEKFIWISILGLCSTKNASGLVTIDIQHLAFYSGVKEKTIEMVLQRCAEKDLITITSQIRTDPYRSVRARTDLCTTRRDERDETERDETEIYTPKLDFEILYKLYPRKEGKKKGLSVCQREIKTEDQFQKLQKAIIRYSNHCKQNISDKKFIKQFSTFMNSWEDWDSDEAGGCDLELGADSYYQDQMKRIENGKS